jgi:hypothetical protein
MKAWPVQYAKSRFSELLDACINEGPQLVTRRGNSSTCPHYRMEANEQRRAPFA